MYTLVIELKIIKDKTPQDIRKLYETIRELYTGIGMEKIISKRDGHFFFICSASKHSIEHTDNIAVNIMFTNSELHDAVQMFSAIKKDILIIPEEFDRACASVPEDDNFFILPSVCFPEKPKPDRHRSLHSDMLELTSMFSHYDGLYKHKIKKRKVNN